MIISWLLFLRRIKESIEHGHPLLLHDVHHCVHDVKDALFWPAWLLVAPTKDVIENSIKDSSWDETSWCSTSLHYSHCLETRSLLDYLLLIVATVLIADLFNKGICISIKVYMLYLLFSFVFI